MGIKNLKRLVLVCSFSKIIVKQCEQAWASKWRPVQNPLGTQGRWWLHLVESHSLECETHVLRVRLAWASGGAGHLTGCARGLQWGDKSGKVVRSRQEMVATDQGLSSVFCRHQESEINPRSKPVGKRGLAMSHWMKGSRRWSWTLSIIWPHFFPSQST